MSDIVQELAMPLDEDNFFRRECPFCYKEFKVQIDDKELKNLSQRLLDEYLVQIKGEDIDKTEEIDNYYCPYCGQQASKDSWWTKEQLSYVSVYAHNIMADIINSQLIGQLKRTFSASSSLFSIKFEGNEIEQQELWISPETNDMKVFHLPCCQEKIKIKDSWSGKIFCLRCGFPHEP